MIRTVPVVPMLSFHFTPDSRRALKFKIKTTFLGGPPRHLHAGIFASDVAQKKASRPPRENDVHAPLVMMLSPFD